MNRIDAKDRILDACDIVRLIGEHVALRARGREFVGLCPFHEDRNPSMTVSPAKQIYKCFACGAGGDAISFVMNYHKMEFVEALRYLADRAGIAMPEPGGERTDDPLSIRQRLLKANGLGLEFFRRMLMDDAIGRDARHYLRSRGINDAMVEAFRLGYAPDEWDALAKRAAERGANIKAFEDAGLIAQRNTGQGHYDRLRHRLIFPILDNIGRPIAFGGRILPGTKRDDSADAKYLNSPESALFNKSATLYGLHTAQRAIIAQRTAVIVEGYTDVIAAHQAGVGNVVATLGTALTAQHAQTLRRYCDKVVLVFDGDEAGFKAADRAVSVFFAENIDIQIAVLPDGLDPADLLGREDGLAPWNNAIDDAIDAMSFQFERVRHLFQQTDTLAGRQRTTEQYLQDLVRLGVRRMDRQRYGLVFARLGDLLGMSPAAVNDALRRIPDTSVRGRRHADAGASTDAAPKPDARELAERYVIGCLLCRPELFHSTMPDGRDLSEYLVPADFVAPNTQRVYQVLYDWLSHEDHPQLTHVRSLMDDEALIQLALDCQLQVERLNTGEAEEPPEIDTECLALQLRASARAVADARSEQHYRQQQTQQRGEDKADRSAVERLLLSVEHSKAVPSARRVPRVID